MMELMSAGVSHELITPLKCVLQLTRSLMKRISDPNQIKQARLITDTTNLLLAQVKCFLDKNTIEANKFRPHFEKSSLKITLKDAVDIMKGQAQEKDISLFLLGFWEEADEVLMLDRLRLH